MKQKGWKIMELLYKPDWERSKQRFQAAWDGEMLDRCCIMAAAPNGKMDASKQRPVPEIQEELEKYYFDETWILERNVARMEQTYFGGDAFPCIWTYFGTGGHAKYLSSKLTYQPNTIWIHPVIEDYKKYCYDFDLKTNEAFQKELKILKFLAKEGMGKYFVSVPDNTGCLDALAQLRGNEELLLDLYDEPEEVSYAIGKLTDILTETSDCILENLKENCDGGSSLGWMGLWAPGKMMQLQCDASVMLSNDMFKKFVMPEFRATAAKLTHPIYHLDGQEQIRHLDDLLTIPNLGMIQWTQVAGQPPATSFIPELKKIQASGKALLIIVTKDQIDGLLSQLSPKGLVLNVLDASSKEEADEIVRYVEKYKYSKEQLK